VLSECVFELLGFSSLSQAARQVEADRQTAPVAEIGSGEQPTP